MATITPWSERYRVALEELCTAETEHDRASQAEQAAGERLRLAQRVCAQLFRERIAAIDGGQP